MDLLSFLTGPLLRDHHSEEDREAFTQLFLCVCRFCLLEVVQLHGTTLSTQTLRTNNTSDHLLSLLDWAQDKMLGAFPDCLRTSAQSAAQATAAVAASTGKRAKRSRKEDPNGDFVAEAGAVSAPATGDSASTTSPFPLRFLRLVANSVSLFLFLFFLPRLVLVDGVDLWLCCSVAIFLWYCVAVWICVFVEVWMFWIRGCVYVRMCRRVVV